MIETAVRHLKKCKKKIIKMIETAVQHTTNAVMQAGIKPMIQLLAAQHTTN